MPKYINQLTNEEIEEFFLLNGYKICYDLTTTDKESLPGIDRGDETIMVRAQQEDKNAINTQLTQFCMKKHPQIVSLPMIMSTLNGYNRIDLIHFSDYYMSKFCFTPDDEEESERLCSEYVHWLARKFPSYADDYNSFFDSQQSSEPKDDFTY